MKTIRAASLKLQQELAKERAAKDGKPQQYEKGDLILWNPKEHPGAMRSEKLAPHWFGPYKVIQQVKNDIMCEHVVMHTIWNLHTSRCKPYFGSPDEALEHGRYDFNQFIVKSIDGFRGNPHKRSSMQLSVIFSVQDSSEAVWVNLTEDISNTEQFEIFVKERPYLYPLRFTAREADRKIAAMNKLAIVDVKIGEELLVSLRYFDGIGRNAVSWYDALELPDVTKTYVVQMRVVRMKNKQRTAVVCSCPLFNAEYSFKSYDLFSCAVNMKEFSERKHVMVTEAFKKMVPKMFE